MREVALLGLLSLSLGANWSAVDAPVLVPKQKEVHEVSEVAKEAPESRVQTITYSEAFRRVKEPGSALQPVILVRSGAEIDRVGKFVRMLNEDGYNSHTEIAVAQLSDRRYRRLSRLLSRYYPGRSTPFVITLRRSHDGVARVSGGFELPESTEQFAIECANCMSGGYSVRPQGPVYSSQAYGSCASGSCSVGPLRRLFR